MRDEIRGILGTQGRLVESAERIGERDDLYALGMTSYATVNVMLALEEAFDIEFPDEMLRKETFESLSAIQAAVSELLDKQLTA